MLLNLLVVLLFIVLLMLVLAFAAFLLMLISSVRIRIHFVRRTNNDSFSLQVRAPLGLYTFKFELPAIQYGALLDEGMSRLVESFRKEKPVQDAVTTAIVDPIEDTIGFDLAVGRFRELRKNAKGLNKWIKKTMKSMHCTELRWLTGIGLGDAPLTATAVGAGWAAKMMVFATIFRVVHLNTQPMLTVQPIYNRYFFSMEVTTAARIRTFSLLVAMASLFFRLKDKKWALRQLQAIRRNRKVQKAANAGTS